MWHKLRSANFDQNLALSSKRCKIGTYCYYRTLVGLETRVRSEASCHWGTWDTCPPDTITTVVNSLQNRVNSITMCITLNAKTGKIVPQFGVSFHEKLLKVVATRGEIFSLKFSPNTVWRPGIHLRGGDYFMPRLKWMGIHLRLGGDERGIIFTWDSFQPSTPPH